MANEQIQIGNVIGVTDKSATTPDGTGFTDPDMATIDAMRARLTAISGTSYSAARLNQMTYNDMVYALRVHDSPTTI